MLTMSIKDNQQTLLPCLDLAGNNLQLTTVQTLQLFEKFKQESKKVKEIENQTKHKNELKPTIDNYNKLSSEKAIELFQKIETLILEATKNNRKQIKIASHIGFYKGMADDEWREAVLWCGHFKDPNNNIEFKFNSYPHFLKKLLSESKDYRDCQISVSKKPLYDDKKQPKGVIYMTFLKWGDEKPNVKSS